MSKVDITELLQVVREVERHRQKKRRGKEVDKKVDYISSSPRRFTIGDAVGYKTTPKT